ncbi:MAG: hypothetical protein IPK13_18700 [Deltaproteobacteria bacterium]|nr:hypothetical protein [Deltaproteobacteria bacterium]
MTRIPIRIALSNPLVLRLLTVFTATIIASACGSQRYIGSIGRDRTYSNRGYGLALRLAPGGLEERWLAIDPMAPSEVPEPLRPTRLHGRIDLDGNGELRFDEAVDHFSPTLRLLSRTSTAARMDLDVLVVARRYAKASLEAIAAGQTRKLGRLSPDELDQAMTSAKRRSVAPDFAALVLELPRCQTTATATATPPPAARRGLVCRAAFIDQPGLVAERGITRRQIIRVILQAPALDDALRADQDQLLRNLVLSRRGPREKPADLW